MTRASPRAPNRSTSRRSSCPSWPSALPAPADRALLSELTAPYRRLALVGLAKNTGKTVALATLLRELESEGRRVGVTSGGRDGEDHDLMHARGAEQLLVHGPIDRRAASSPDVADGLVISSGAILDRDIEEVVLLTSNAVEVVGLPKAEEAARALALEPRFPLTAESEQIAELLDDNPDAERLSVS